LVTDNGVGQTTAEQAVRLPMAGVSDVSANASFVGVESVSGGRFDLGFLNSLVQLLGAPFNLAPFDLTIPVAKSKKQKKIINKIYVYRDSPSATPAELAAALTKLVRYY
jgi:hypothetical protein